MVNLDKRHHVYSQSLISVKKIVFCFKIKRHLILILYFRETRTNWDQEVRDDVIDECNKHGGVLHLYVDQNSPQGNVYVKCPSISAAVASVNALHGRFYAGQFLFLFFNNWQPLDKKNPFDLQIQIY